MTEEQALQTIGINTIGETIESLMEDAMCAEPCGFEPIGCSDCDRAIIVLDED